MMYPIAPSRSDIVTIDVTRKIAGHFNFCACNWVLERNVRERTVIAIGTIKRKICSFASITIACAQGAPPALMIGFTIGP